MENEKPKYRQLTFEQWEYMESWSKKYQHDINTTNKTQSLIAQLKNLILHLK